MKISHVISALVLTFSASSAFAELGSPDVTIYSLISIKIIVSCLSQNHSSILQVARGHHI